MTEVPVGWMAGHSWHVCCCCSPEMWKSGSSYPRIPVTVSSVLELNIIDRNSVVNPETYLLDPNSGALWIRIRIPNTDPDPHTYCMYVISKIEAKAAKRYKILDITSQFRD